MKTRKPYLILIFLSLSVVFADTIPDPVPTEQAERDLRSTWSKKYPSETIISVTSAGDPGTLEKVDKKGKLLERKLKVPFQVVAEKAGTQREFEAGANYIQKGNQWKFSEIGIGDVKAIASENEKAPKKPEVKELVVKAFSEKYPDYTWSKVLIDDGTFNKGSNGGFYRYEGDINRTDSEGQTIQCKDIDFMLAKDSSGAWAVDITSQGKCY
ncbi:MAG: hypothetical protein IBJ01_01665 [Leptospira sp.]|uniref:hypothetical protein n=1 Tax=Leptospira sp. TaxID=178 RepID=UPI0025C4D23E|nr:hypothetical protein [Leptospira sp.]MBL0953457.1 hypothetical protein [Leptospira sp.]